MKKTSFVFRYLAMLEQSLLEDESEKAIERELNLSISGIVVLSRHDSGLC